MKHLCTIIFLFWLPFTGLSQRTLFGNLENYLSDYVATLPVSGSNVYRDPAEADRLNLGNATTMIMNGDLSEAQEIAMLSGYEVIRYIDNSQLSNREFYGLQPQPGSSNYWGILFLNPDACIDVILQCPHPRFDSNTGLQGAYIFTHLDAKGLMISGTHRCNSIAPTDCDGTTSVCGSSSAYRISDIAHNTESLFQTYTEALAEDSATYFIQLHGFAKNSGDPNLIISNGTRQTPQEDPIADIRNGLWTVDPDLTFKIIHIHTDWTRLTAFTNTQGRYLNGSTDPCFQNASASTGRFIHIEQEYDRFRKDASGWELMRRGLEEAFECQVSTSQVEIQEELDIRIIASDDQFVAYFQDDRMKWINVFTMDGRRILSGPLVDGAVYQVPDQMMLIISISDLNSGQLLLGRKIWIP